MCDFLYYFVIDIIVNVDIIIIMKVIVDMYFFVIRVMWIFLCFVFVYGYIVILYYVDLGKNMFLLLLFFSFLIVLI